MSVCSGIEAASVAWEPLGWRAAAFAEIEPFPCRLLHEHFAASRPLYMPDPDEPGIAPRDARRRRAAARAVDRIPAATDGPLNFGDFTRIEPPRLGQVDVLVGGTPCQAFSHAGKRLSLADARGNLSLAYAVLAHELARSNGLQWAVWENVPGVLGTDDNAFGCLLGSLIGADASLPLPSGIGRWPDAGMVAGPGGVRAAWRILDAQHFGLAQRRRRVFLVVSFGDGDPAAVLFERQGLRRHSPPRRKASEDVAGTLAPGTHASGFNGRDAERGNIALAGGGASREINVAPTCLASRHRADFESEILIAHTLRAEGFDASEDGTGLGTPLVPIAFDCKAGGDTALATGDVVTSLRGEGHGGGHAAVAYGWAVRRLTPRECERLQGFPDRWTAIEGAADGPRYKALGNSMAVPVMRWIGERIAALADRD